MSKIYQNGLQELVEQNLDVVNSSGVVLILMSDSYTPDPEADEFIGDVAADELDADGYTQGFGSADRQTPTSRSWQRNDSVTPTRIELQFDNVTWSDLGGGVSANNDTVGGVILAEERSSDSDSPLLAFDTLQDDRSTNGSDITYATSSDGMINVESNP